MINLLFKNVDEICKTDKDGMNILLPYTNN